MDKWTTTTNNLLPFTCTCNAFTTTKILMFCLNPLAPAALRRDLDLVLSVDRPLEVLLFLPISPAPRVPKTRGPPVRRVPCRRRPS